MKIDLVFVTKIEHLYTLNISIKKALELFDIKSIYIVTNKKYFKFFNSYSGRDIHFVDEDSLLPDMTLRQLQSHRAPHFPARAGWYFQQFLKLGIAWIDSLSENYLVVDADTVFLRKVPLIEDDKFVFMQGTEFHKPYFENYEVLLGEAPNRTFSFITQYMVFNKTLVQELLKRLETNFSDVTSWNWLIINNMKGDGISLFSEYETYGHFIKNNYPERCVFIDLPWLRGGTELLKTTHPRPAKIEELEDRYYYVSIEQRTFNYFHTIKERTFRFIFRYYQRFRKRGRIQLF